MSLRYAHPSAPRLALVLGSGGVRSAAAIGIAEVLAQAGHRPGLIVGCSSGALFGATIAMGLDAAAAMRLAVSLWSDDLTRERRWRAYAQLVAPRLLGFGPDFALRGSARIAERIERAFGDRRIEELPIPLRITATEAASGEPVTLTSGRLADALRASIAVPFLFPPVSIGGRRLVDGVMSDPLPLAAAADAQAIVALGFEGAMPRRIDRASRLVAQASTTLINNLMRSRVALARSQGARVVDMHLELDRRVGLWETAALPAVFEAGRRAARVQIARLDALGSERHAQ